MRVLSLFAGIGAHCLGLEWSGMKVVGQIEIDEYCKGILQHHWPDVPKWGDIKEVSVVDIRRRCGDIDLITGGFPCQDISVAGKGAGLDGARSGLLWEMLRIIEGIEPPWLLLENVPALRTRGIDRIIAALRELGYTVECIVVGAEAVGAPHRRHRVLIVAYNLRFWERRRQRESERRLRACDSGSTSRASEGRQGSVESMDNADGNGLTGRPVSDLQGVRMPEATGASSGHAHGSEHEILPDANGKPSGRKTRGAKGKRTVVEANASSAQSGGSGEDVSDANGGFIRTQSRGRSGARGQDQAEPRVASAVDDPASEPGLQSDLHKRYQQKLAEPSDSSYWLVDATISGLEGWRESRGARASFAFPAPPGEDQHPWEKPRLLKPRVDGATDGITGGMARYGTYAGERRDAIKAIGNSNPPQLFALVGRCILRLDQMMMAAE